MVTIKKKRFRPKILLKNKKTEQKGRVSKTPTIVSFGFREQLGDEICLIEAIRSSSFSVYVLSFPDTTSLSKPPFHR